MSSSEVKTVTEGRVLSKPVALPTKAELPAPTDIPENAASPNGGDAVSIDVSGTVTQQSATEGQVAESSNSKDVSTVSPETATRLAENLRRALSHITSTKVSFDVSIQSEGKSSLSFQVIDTKSGEVLREFPPAIAESLSHRAELADAKGLLVEDAA